MKTLRAAWLLPALVCHFAFSWIGFNPTDDGWLPAVAQRIAHGQVPHRDFIFVRPALSALLEVPLVWWGGDHVLLLARLYGWITLAAICWIWSGWAEPGGTSPLARFLIYVVALALSAHNFDVMGWHTLDALLFGTAAVWCLDRRRWVFAAFVLAGLAPLCRQNFVLFAPLLALAFRLRLREWPSALGGAILPGAVYLGWMAGVGALHPFILQVTAVRGEFLRVGVFRLLLDKHFLGGAFLALVLAGALGRPTWTRPLVALAVLGAAVQLWRGPAAYQEFTFLLLGAALLFVAAETFAGGSDGNAAPFRCAVALAWIASISIGYNSPALAAGPLFLLLWRYGRARSAALAAALAVLVAVALVHARRQFPYRDLPAAALHAPLGAVLPVGAGIATNSRTWSTLADLRAVTADLDRRGLRYAILTDYPAFWIHHREPNPLPCEWPQDTELGNSPLLQAQLIAAVQHLPPNFRIVLQRFTSESLAREEDPVARQPYLFAVQHWAAAHLRFERATAAFDVYAPTTRSVSPRPAAFK